MMLIVSKCFQQFSWLKKPNIKVLNLSQIAIIVITVSFIYQSYSCLKCVRVQMCECICVYKSQIPILLAAQ